MLTALKFKYKSRDNVFRLRKFVISQKTETKLIPGNGLNLIDIVFNDSVSVFEAKGSLNIKRLFLSAIFRLS